MSKKILLLGGDFTEDYEVFVPYQALTMLGYTVDAVCPGRVAGEYLRTAVHDFEGDQTYSEKRGHNFLLTADFDKVDVSDYEAVFIPGGRAPEYLRLNERVLEIVREFKAAGKPIAAICHAPQVLAAADIIKGANLTSCPEVSFDVKAAGGNYIAIDASEAVVDNDAKIVTSPAWPGCGSICRELAVMLGARIEI